MARAVFRPLQTGDIEHVAAHMRDADRQELTAAFGDDVGLQAVLARSVLMSSQCWAWAAPDGEPVAVFGVAPVSLLQGIGAPWFLSTERAYESPRALVADGRRYIAEMRKTFSMLSNYVDARNDRSIRWLQRLGFSIYPAEPYGVAGMPFHRFVMRTA